MKLSDDGEGQGILKKEIKIEKGAQLQRQLAQKMGRAYVALFLFFYKINIKIF